MDDCALWQSMRKCALIETELLKKETRIAKKYAKFREKSVKLHRVGVEIIEQDGAEANLLKQLSTAVAKVREYIIEEERCLQETQAKAACLEQEWRERTASKLELMLKFSHLKDATRLFINCHELPRSIQGVAVSEKSETTQWKPFGTDSELHSIWAESQLASFYNTKWEELTSRQCKQRHSRSSTVA